MSAVTRLQQSSVNRSSTSLITPTITALSEHHTNQVDQHLLDFLTAEVTRLLIDSEQVARARRAAHEKLVEADFLSLADKAAALSLDDTPSAPTPTVSAEKRLALRNQADEAVKRRLDTMGFKVGWAMAERLARDRPRFPSAPPAAASSVPPSAIPHAPIPDALEAVKFICKDVWIALYDKQIDNLRTNHRGVYVVVDNAFKPLARVSGAGEDDEVGRMVRFFLAFPSGIIRGALATLGISCTVTAESAAVPQSTFQITTIKPGAL